MDGNAGKHIDAYVEYNNIVGMDDGGQMMSEQEFEAYKAKVREARRNRLYVHWRNSYGQDCKTIGPASQCFCGHRFKQHNFDNVKTKQVHCKDNRCKCKMFTYIPVCKYLHWSRKSYFVWTKNLYFVTIPNIFFFFHSWLSRPEMPLQAFMPRARSKRNLDL